MAVPWNLWSWVPWLVGWLVGSVGWLVGWLLAMFDFQKTGGGRGCVFVCVFLRYLQGSNLEIFMLKHGQC